MNAAASGFPGCHVKVFAWFGTRQSSYFARTRAYRRASLLVKNRLAGETREMAPPRIPAERRAAVLAEMSALLGSSLDYERALQRLPRLAAPVLGDLFTIALVHVDAR